MPKAVSMIWLFMETIDSKGTLASSQKHLRFQSSLFLVNPAAGSPRSKRGLLASLALMVLILGSIESI